MLIHVPNEANTLDGCGLRFAAVAPLIQTKNRSWCVVAVGGFFVCV
uniref:Uncharacterized protein n=1 Tax=uncultured bacterium A1Q1_fos_500 TaxID=1256579 RepID=L7VX89_9BACT|nr:hypothetical protein [uncultured bacterium A1Q1_fos_500]